MSRELSFREIGRLLVQVTDSAIKTAELARSLGHAVRFAPQLRSSDEHFVCRIDGPSPVIWGSIHAYFDGRKATETTILQIENRSREELVLAVESRYEADLAHKALTLYLSEEHATHVVSQLDMPNELRAMITPGHLSVLGRVYPAISFRFQDHIFASVTEQLFSLLRSPTPTWLLDLRR